VVRARFCAAQEKRRQTGQKTSREDAVFPNDPRREHLPRRNAKRDEQRSKRTIQPRRDFSDELVAIISGWEFSAGRIKRQKSR
jgi:hypothetical protein